MDVSVPITISKKNMLLTLIYRSLENNDGNEKPKGIFYFTHSKLILSFLSTINVTPNQKPLTADHYKEHLNREWKTSMLSPFNSNIIAIFYRYICSELYKLININLMIIFL